MRNENEGGFESDIDGFSIECVCVCVCKHKIIRIHFDCAVAVGKSLITATKRVQIRLMMLTQGKWFTWITAHALNCYCTYFFCVHNRFWMKNGTSKQQQERKPLSSHAVYFDFFFAGKSSGLYYIDTIHFLSSEELFFSLSRSIPLPFVHTFINLFWVESFISLTDVGADCMDCVALFHVQMLIVSNSIRYIC